MTKTRNKIVSIIAAIAVMLSVFCVAGTTSASADSDRVSLYVDQITHIRASSYSREREILIQTRGNATDEAVYVHTFSGSVVTDHEATLFKTLDDGSKVWRTTLGFNTGKYAIKYVADGVTYWDNNNGKDYDDLSMGASTNIVVRKHNKYDGDFTAELRNLGYEKNVFARYTTDNWETYHDVPLTYQAEGSNSEIEKWSASYPTDVNYYTSDEFEYAICYQVNGQEYWANNFGSNYDQHYEITTSYY